MSSESHVRIDEGIKRGPKSDRARMRQEARSKRSDFGQSHLHYSPEKRSEIILGVPKAILAGKTTKEYAAEQGMPASTLRAWLVGDADTEAMRGTWLALELMSKIQEIEDSQDALSLAQAREGFKAWSWIAERREHRLYGQRQHIELETQPLSSVDKDLLGSARELLKLYKAKLRQLESVAPAAIEEKPLESG